MKKIDGEGPVDNISFTNKLHHFTQKRKEKKKKKGPNGTNHGLEVNLDDNVHNVHSIHNNHHVHSFYKVHNIHIKIKKINS
jgi:hypothetical protein